MEGVDTIQEKMEGLKQKLLAWLKESRHDTRFDELMDCIVLLGTSDDYLLASTSKRLRLIQKLAKSFIKNNPEVCATREGIEILEGGIAEIVSGIHAFDEKELKEYVQQCLGRLFLYQYSLGLRR